MALAVPNKQNHCFGGNDKQTPDTKQNEVIVYLLLFHHNTIGVTRRWSYPPKSGEENYEPKLFKKGFPRGIVK